MAKDDDEQFLVMMAAMAMQGMMSMEISMKAGMEEDIISIMAFDQAEAMLAEWKKRRAAAAALKETGDANSRS